MKHPVLLVAALTVTVWIAPALARLGETPAQSARRYGAPLESGGGVPSILKGAEQDVFHFEGWQVVAAYVDGRTARIEYSKLRGAPQHDSVVVTQADIDVLLESERDGGSWEEIVPEKTSNPFTVFARAVENTRSWTNAATGASAELRLNKMNLTFVAPSAADAAGKTPSSAPGF